MAKMPDMLQNKWMADRLLECIETVDGKLQAVGYAVRTTFMDM